MRIRYRRLWNRYQMRTCHVARSQLYRRRCMQPNTHFQYISIYKHIYENICVPLSKFDCYARDDRGRFDKNRWNLQRQRRGTMNRNRLLRLRLSSPSVALVDLSDSGEIVPDRPSLKNWGNFWRKIFRGKICGKILRKKFAEKICWFFFA